MTDSLTLRQRFYLTQVFLGKTNVQIAREQGVSESTVKRGLMEAYQKLGISSCRQLFPLVILAQRENCTKQEAFPVYKVHENGDISLVKEEVVA